MSNYPPINDMEALFEILDGYDDNWEVLQEDESAGKHDCTDYRYLLRYKPTQQLYYFSCEKSYNHGFDPGDVIDYPVEFEKAKITGTKTRYKYTVDRS